MNGIAFDNAFIYIITAIIGVDRELRLKQLNESITATEYMLV